jgi:hypothetical protein
MEGDSEAESEPEAGGGGSRSKRGGDSEEVAADRHDGRVLGREGARERRWRSVSAVRQRAVSARERGEQCVMEVEEAYSRYMRLACRKLLQSGQCTFADVC